MKKVTIFFFMILLYHESFSCISCNKSVVEGIFNHSFFTNLFIMLTAFIVLGSIIAVLTRLSTKRYNDRMAADPTSKELSSIPLTAASAVLGMGIGGFIDGIVFHQLLQWHQMLTDKYPATTVTNKSINMFWDGIFHSFTLLTCLVGIYLLWRLLNKININRSGYLLVGGMLMGWGLFNLVEGIIDHHILRLHNVREFSVHQEMWNYSFLVFGAFLFFIGYFLTKIGQRQISKIN